jgi:hypothetical protein
LSDPSDILAEKMREKVKINIKMNQKASTKMEGNIPDLSFDISGIAKKSLKPTQPSGQILKPWKSVMDGGNESIVSLDVSDRRTLISSTQIESTQSQPDTTLVSSDQMERSQLQGDSMSSSRVQVAITETFKQLREHGANTDISRETDKGSTREMFSTIKEVLQMEFMHLELGQHEVKDNLDDLKEVNRKFALEYESQKEKLMQKETEFDTTQKDVQSTINGIQEYQRNQELEENKLKESSKFSCTSWLKWLLKFAFVVFMAIIFLAVLLIIFL